MFSILRTTESAQQAGNTSKNDPNKDYEHEFINIAAKEYARNLECNFPRDIQETHMSLINLLLDALVLN